MKNLSCFLPGGKADDVPSPSLPKARSKILRLRPWTPWLWGILGFCNNRVKCGRALNRLNQGRGQLADRPQAPDPRPFLLHRPPHRGGYPVRGQVTSEHPAFIRKIIFGSDFYRMGREHANPFLLECSV